MVARVQHISTHRALVVEDNEHVCYMLEFILKRAGYEVNAVTNGRDAQAAIENLEPVDVIVLDLMLPYISGYQLISEVRDGALHGCAPSFATLATLASSFDLSLVATCTSASGVTGAIFCMFPL